MSLVVYTARFGDTDPLRAPLVIDPGVQYLCFSDAPVDVPPYEWIDVPRSQVLNPPSPRMLARQVKVCADHPRLTAADVTLWHDASYQLAVSPAWVDAAIAEVYVAALAHPRRGQIEQEAMAIARYGYVSVETARAHVARYRAKGFTENVLTATGLLARRRTPQTTRFNAYWWTEVRRWNGRDQASVDYAAWRAGVRIAHLPGRIKDNPFAFWRPVDEGAA